MLLDAIIWLPTLFTYIVFLLILIILFFIVAYVSHKIYISIYDNLPLPAAPGSRSSVALREYSRDFSRLEHVGAQLSSRSVWIHNRSTIFESPVVRITLTLEPCFLISVALDIYSDPNQRAISCLCNCNDSDTKCTMMADQAVSNVRVLKYYDDLASVPRLKVLLRCNERKNMRLVLDDVIKDVMEARCSENASACPTPR
ncbi:uncharacterized protein [Drosophila virilis]|uniref:Uncharacterized protein n=1 Tax=Drosophila virilis TaxID=7244 RepID=B4LB64_DROVI|nr:uncharacterized protein LOC6623807 [Drosophila virilis]XP_032290979.1 uncharacterized protein LOC6623807 [Drosophila virilis]EDW68628.1 uncharacterized protein Dvir_GJ12815 [Drosophila virilis]